MDEPEHTSDLYHPDLLAYAREPVHWRKDHAAPHIIRAYNPICGDKYEIRIELDGMIKEISFCGYGCIVSKASTELLCELLTGKDTGSAAQLIRDHLRVLTAHSAPGPDDHRLKPFLVAQKFPGRMQCVTLGWDAVLRSGLLL